MTQKQADYEIRSLPMSGPASRPLQSVHFSSVFGSMASYLHELLANYKLL